MNMEPKTAIRAAGDAPGRDRLRAALPVLIVLYCALQPVLDVTAYWLRQTNTSSLWTTLLRLALLCGSLMIGYLVTERRSLYLAFGLVTVLYLAGHVAACVSAPGGYADWTEDLTDQARTLVLPLTALSFMSFLRANKRCFPALLDGMAGNLFLIALVELLSVLTGTDPHTYSAKGIGVRGWFIWTSPQSAILSLLAPVVIVWAVRRFPKRVLPTLAAAALGLGLLYLYGTRLGFLCLSGIGLGIGLCLLLSGRERRRQGAAVLLVALALTALYPVSPMVRNRTAMEANAAVKQARVSAAAEAAGVPAGTETTHEPAALRAAYRYNLQGMIDRFGLEKTAARYGYTLNANRICDDRIMKTTFSRMLMEEASEQSVLPRLFGLEIGRFRVEQTEVYRFETDDWALETETYDPENDFHGVAALNGWVGLSLLTAFLLCVGLRALIAVWKQRSRFAPVFAAFLGAYAIALIYAYNTASTLRRNNASVYFAWVLAGLWYLSVRPHEKGAKHD